PALKRSHMKQVERRYAAAANRYRQLSTDYAHSLVRHGLAVMIKSGSVPRKDLSLFSVDPKAQMAEVLEHQ
ncbi:hypothetical protein M9458_007518, partial [Cirrhinus mrigala]